MPYRIVYRPEARLELKQLLADISKAGGRAVANAYVGGIVDVIRGLQTFPKRGTERVETLPGLRIIGYRRSASLAFVVRESEVIVLGVFHGGRDITAALLQERL